MKPVTSENSSEQRSLGDLCRQAIGYLDRTYELPPEELERNVDRAETAVVKLRDGLIEGLRDEATEGSQEQARRRPALDQVNISLSLITGVAYPSSRIHRNYIEDARQILIGVKKDIGE